MIKQILDRRIICVSFSASCSCSSLLNLVELLVTLVESTWLPELVEVVVELGSPGRDAPSWYCPYEPEARLELSLLLMAGVQKSVGLGRRFDELFGWHLQFVSRGMNGPSLTAPFWSHLSRVGADDLRLVLTSYSSGLNTNMLDILRPEASTLFSLDFVGC